MDTAEAAQQAADIALLQKAISDHIFVAQMTTSVKMLIEFLQQNPAAMSSKQAVLNAVVEAKLFSNRQQPGRAWNTIIREYRKSQRASINKTVGVTLEQGWNVEWEPSDEPGGPDQPLFIFAATGETQSAIPIWPPLHGDWSAHWVSTSNTNKVVYRSSTGFQQDQRPTHLPAGSSMIIAGIRRSYDDVLFYLKEDAGTGDLVLLREVSAPDRIRDPSQELSCVSSDPLVQQFARDLWEQEQKGGLAKEFLVLGPKLSIIAQWYEGTPTGLLAVLPKTSCCDPCQELWSASQRHSKRGHKCPTAVNCLTYVGDGPGQQTRHNFDEHKDQMIVDSATGRKIQEHTSETGAQAQAATEPTGSRFTFSIDSQTHFPSLQAPSPQPQPQPQPQTPVPATVPLQLPLRTAARSLNTPLQTFGFFRESDVVECWVCGENVQLQDLHSHVRKSPKCQPCDGDLPCPRCVAAGTENRCTYKKLGNVIVDEDDSEQTVAMFARKPPGPAPSTQALASQMASLNTYAGPSGVMLGRSLKRRQGGEGQEEEEEEEEGQEGKKTTRKRGRMSKAARKEAGKKEKKSTTKDTWTRSALKSKWNSASDAAPMTWRDPTLSAFFKMQGERVFRNLANLPGSSLTRAQWESQLSTDVQQIISSGEPKCDPDFTLADMATATSTGFSYVKTTTALVNFCLRNNLLHSILLRPLFNGNYSITYHDLLRSEAHKVGKNANGFAKLPPDIRAPSNWKKSSASDDEGDQVDPDDVVAARQYDEEGNPIIRVVWVTCRESQTVLPEEERDRRVAENLLIAERYKSGFAHGTHADHTISTVRLNRKGTDPVAQTIGDFNERGDSESNEQLVELISTHDAELQAGHRIKIEMIMRGPDGFTAAGEYWDSFVEAYTSPAFNFLFEVMVYQGEVNAEVQADAFFQNYMVWNGRMNGAFSIAPIPNPVLAQRNVPGSAAEQLFKLSVRLGQEKMNNGSRAGQFWVDNRGRNSLG